MTRTREWEATLGLVLAHDGVEIYTSTPLCFNQYKRVAKKSASYWCY